MHVGYATPACEQRPHVPACLRLMQLAERPAHLRYRDVLGDVRGDDEKQTAGGATLV
jgi:hypothetical protein